MKATINSKRYDTENCEILGTRDHYNNGNYSGTTNLLRAKNGVLLTHTDTNGQDCYLHDSMSLADLTLISIDNFEMDDDQVARCAELKLIEIV